MGDWDPAPTLDTEVFIQGVGSLSAKVSKATYTSVKPVADLDLSDTIIYIWILGSSIAQFDTKALGGIRIRVEEGATPNWGEWYVAGKDIGYEGGWQCLAVRTTQSFDDVSDPAPNRASIDGVGVVFKILASAAKNNVWWDAVRYGTGLRIKAGTEALPGTFADVVVAEEIADNRWGIITETEGVIMIQGKLFFGSTTLGEATYFKDTIRNLVHRDRPFGVFYELKIEGNATATTKVFFGTESEGKGISGCIFSCAGASKYKVTAVDEYITELGFYGCTFLDADTISLPAYTVEREVLSSTFEACAEVLADDCIVQFCKFISSDGRALRMVSETKTITDCDFINCPHGVHIPNAGTYEFNGLMFSGCGYDIENSGNDADVTVNCENSNASTHEETGTPPGTTTIVSSATHTLTGMKENTEVTYVEVSTQDVLFHVENVGIDGKTDYVYDATIEKTVDIHIHHVTHVPILIAGVLLTSAGGSIPITQFLDRVYSNP